ncbi:MAG: Na+/H+ antiporter NhaC [bacterium]
MKNTARGIPVIISVIPVLSLIITLYISIAVFKQTPHLPLIFSSAIATLVAIIYQYKWKEIQKGIINTIAAAMGAILILMVIGLMIGTWITSGIVPSMIYFGLKLLSPGIFLAATLIICSIVSLGTGSSWSTAGTIGVALIGVGSGLGIPIPMVGGAIISGAYFGDKMSPLSDTTNLAPAIAGADLFDHIGHMIYTTGPAYLITIILYIIIGTKFSSNTLDTQGIEAILTTIQSDFFIHPVLLIPPCLVIVMVVKKIPPLPALIGGSFIGIIFALIFQSTTIVNVLNAAFSGYVSDTGDIFVDNLLTRGGLMSMMETVALIICALTFGGIMEKTGMLEAIAGALLKKVKRTGSLITTTIFSCIGMNIIACDQYMAIVIPGRMYKKAFEKKNLEPKNLSRCLEDSGTLTSALIPWNSGGAFMYATLGINPLLYLPYAFLNLLTPLISIFYGYTGITITKIVDEESTNHKK